MTTINLLCERLTVQQIPTYTSKSSLSEHSFITKHKIYFEKKSSFAKTNHRIDIHKLSNS